jgi:hypothetical protein
MTNQSRNPAGDALRKAGAIPSMDQILQSYPEVTQPMKISSTVSGIDVVDAVIAVADASGGATGSALTADLKNLDGTALAKTGVFMILSCDTQYAGSKDANATTTFGTATKGSILASGTAWAIVKADANGQFACTVTNSADETVYFSCATVDGGVDAVANGVVIRGCIPDDATWSA